MCIRDSYETILKAREGDPEAVNAVLIQTLEDAVQLSDTLLRRLHLAAAGGVLPLTAVLVLCHQQLHKPGLMLGGVAGDFPQIFRHARRQKGLLISNSKPSHWDIAFLILCCQKYT